MDTRRSGLPGFTLIELLTVIAIISILAALTATVLPRVLERAKITSTESIFSQMRTILTEYTADNASYPPIYGYIDKARRGKGAGAQWYAADFNVRPYMQYLGHFKNNDLFDDWTQSGDLDGDGRLGLMEFSPMDLDPQGGVYGMDGLGFGLGSGAAQEVARQMGRTRSPITYLPVNKRQMNKFAEYHNPDGSVKDGRKMDVLTLMSRMPPAQYDAYVLMSIGPEESLHGVLPAIDPASNDDLGPYRYHYWAMMGYFLATRDANENGQLDFDFRSRTRANEGVLLSEAGLGSNLPDGTALGGPLIYTSP